MYSVRIAVTPASFATVCVTTWFSAVASTILPARRSIVRSIDVISRPNDAAEVTSLPLKRHTYGWCVWALTTTSTAGSSRLTMSSRSGPVKFSHLFTSMKPREKGAFCGAALVQEQDDRAHLPLLQPRARAR